MSEHAMHQIRALAFSYERALTLAGKHAGLPPTAVRALDHVLSERLTLSELARRLSLSPSAITHLVDALEQTGLARRERVAGDRRRWVVCSTPEGEAWHSNALQPVYEAVEHAIVDDADGCGSDCTIRFLERLALKLDPGGYAPQHATT